VSDAGDGRSQRGLVVRGTTVTDLHAGFAVMASCDTRMQGRRLDPIAFPLPVSLGRR